MIPRSHLITLNQVMIDILKTTNSPIVRVVCNVGLTVRAPGGRGRVGRRAHILGAIEGLSFSSKLSSPSRVW